MKSLQQCVLTVIIGALISGILQSMVRDGTPGRILRLLSGIFLTITLLSSVRAVSFREESLFFQNALADGEKQAAIGEEMKQAQMAEIISRQAEAYILEEAAQRGAELRVTVILDQNHLPVQAEVSGPCSAQMRKELSDIIEEDLGIAKENQLWSG